LVKKQIEKEGGDRVLGVMLVKRNITQQKMYLLNFLKQHSYFMTGIVMQRMIHLLN
jgi:hypothetical protein